MTTIRFSICNSGASDLKRQNYMIINGFCRGIFKELPFEFAAEASQLLRVNLEGTVG